MNNFEIVKDINARANQGKFKADFNDISEKYSYPEWFSNDKLGIFIHWGLYSVPAFDNEWYPRLMYGDIAYARNEHEKDTFEKYRTHHEKTYGSLKEFGYKDFIPMFKAEKWDPKKWAELFRKSGARYVVPVAEHHDGFPMYDCPFTEWNAAKMGPKRDVVKELSEAVRAEGMRLGVSTHRAYNWRFYTFNEKYDNYNPEYAGLYGRPHPVEQGPDFKFVTDWLERTWDLVDRFQPDILYFDFGWHADEFQSFRPHIFSYYYNQAEKWGKEVLVNFKKKCPMEAGIWDLERGQLDGILDIPWQTDTSLSYKSWCCIQDDEFRKADRLIHDLIDIVSKNGNLLINVGPLADGTIPAEAENLLLAMGKWLEINGEAIYGTTHWHSFGEGPNMIKGGHFAEKSVESFSAEDIRYTVKGNVLYAIALGVPEKSVNMQLPAESFDVDMIEKISILGEEQNIKWKFSNDVLSIDVPMGLKSKYATVFKIEMKDAKALEFEEIKTKSTFTMNSANAMQ